MTIRPMVLIQPIHAGVAARATEIGLTCHGRDSARAISAVRATVSIWARALASDGQLEQTLTRLGVIWETDGDGISIEPSVQPVTA